MKDTNGVIKAISNLKGNIKGTANARTVPIKNLTDLIIISKLLAVGSSFKSVFASIDKVVADSGKKRSKAGSKDVEDFKLKEI